MTRGKATLFGQRDQLIFRPQGIVRQFTAAETCVGEEGADTAFNIHPAIRTRRAGLGGDGIEIGFAFQQMFRHRF